MTPGIATLLRLMPEGYDEACFETGAIVRKRDIKSPDDLMMLSLFHLLTGCSLIEISEVARLADIGDISDVAFMKRFKGCNNWFKWIIDNIVADGIIKYMPPKSIEQYRILALDASDVREKGRSGRMYRLHFALDILKMHAALYNITSTDVGEKLTNFALSKGDLVLGDRVYSSVNGIEHCLACEAEYLMRVRMNGFRAFSEDGEKIDLHDLVVGSGTDIGDSVIFLEGNEGKMIPARICYMKKDPEAIEASRKRLKKRDNKHQYKSSDKAKAFNDYIVVITSLNGICVKDIFNLYRYRWQVELHFKRMKSILDYGELPKKTEESIFTWLNGKLMIALLIEKLIGNAVFSPEKESYEEYLARDEDDTIAPQE